MSTQGPRCSRPTGRFIIAGAGALALLTLGSFSEAQELPNFRRGMWEFHRTITDASGKTQTVAAKKCTNPTDDMRKQNDMLAKAGCKFSAGTRSGSTYSSTSHCNIHGLAVQSKSVIAADGDSSYKVNVESQQDGAQTRELLVARRTGDC